MKVTISIPVRQGFPGYWALQKFFAPGTHEVEVTEAQLAELKADPVLKVMDEAEAAPAAVEVKAEEPVSPGKPFNPAAHEESKNHGKHFKK